MLVSSHLLSEVAHTVDSVVILDRGRLVTHSTLDELMAMGGAQVVRVRTSRADEASIALQRQGTKVQQLAHRPHRGQRRQPRTDRAPPPHSRYRSSSPSPTPPTWKISSLNSPPIPTAPGLRRSEGTSMTVLLRVEILKLRTVRLTYGLNPHRWRAHHPVHHHRIVGSGQDLGNLRRGLAYHARRPEVGHHHHQLVHDPRRPARDPHR